MPSTTIFSENSVIEHDGRPLRILQLLASGLTGEVYRAEWAPVEGTTPIIVAVKAMKSLEFQLARQLFYQEGTTLSLLMYLEDEVNDPLIEGGIKIAPRYYGLSDYRPSLEADSVPYFVMEFIEGEKVPDLLRKNGPFSEKEGLVLGWHLYRIFDILHTRLQKSYIDLKFENLVWVPRNDRWGGQLRMLDFGTLEDIKGNDIRGIRRDLLLGGVFLLAVLTNRILDYSLGELHEPAEPIIKYHASRITWGTRRLLSRLLHRNPQIRPQTAAEVLAELRLLASFWVQSEEQLLRRIERELSKAEEELERAKGQRSALSSEGVNAAVRALAALDILRVRAPHLHSETNVERARSVLAFGDYLERGQALLRGRSFTLARQVFEEGMNWVEDPATLRRWSYIARLGEEISPADFEKHFPQIKSLLDFLNNPDPNPQRWASGLRDVRILEEKLRASNPESPLQGLRSLIIECDLYASFEQAQQAYFREDYQSAAELYGRVDALLAELPVKAQKAIQEEIGDIQVRRRAAESLFALQEARNLYRQAENALREGKWKQAVEHASAAYRLYRPVREEDFHLHSLESLLSLALEIGPRETPLEKWLLGISDLAGIAWYPIQVNPESSRLLLACLQLPKLSRALQFQDVPEFLITLREFFALSRRADLTEKVATWAAQYSLLVQNYTFLSGLADLIGEIVPLSPLPDEWRTAAQRMRRQHQEMMLQEVDHLRKQAQLVLLPVLSDWEEGFELADTLNRVAVLAEQISAFDLLALGEARQRLEKAHVLLIRALQFLDDVSTPQYQEIQSNLIKIEQAIQTLSRSEEASVTVLRHERKERLKRLSAERRELDEQLEWLFRTPAHLAEEVHGYYQKVSQQILDFLYRCYLAEGLEREDLKQALSSLKYGASTAEENISLDVLRQWAIQALNRLGALGWEQVVTRARQQTQTFAEWLIQMQQLFESGQVARLAAELDRTQQEYGSSQEWKTLKARLSQVQAWKAWCEIQQERFKAKVLDETLLQDLRLFWQTGLSAVYWEQSPVPQYLEELRAEYESYLHRYFPSRFTSPRFLETLRALLNIAWTQSLSKDPAQATARSWNVQSWLRKVYQLDERSLYDFVAHTPLPAGQTIEQALSSLSFETWLFVYQEEERRKREERLAETRRWQMVFQAGLVGLFILLVAVGLFFGWRFLAGAGSVPSPSPTASLMATATLVEATPTPTKIPSPTPTETPTPLVISPSAFLVANPSVIYPPPPILSGEAYWVIDDDNATFSSMNWKSFEHKQNDPAETNFSYRYTDSGNTSVSWQMDVPFDVEGIYGVYILDTGQHSEGTYKFQVFLDDVSVQPVWGISEVSFLPYRLQVRGQNNAKISVWRLLGFYSIVPGQKLRVFTEIPALSRKTFAADRVLIVRLDQATRRLLESLPPDYLLVSLLDDGQIEFSENEREKWTPFSNVLAWGGKMLSQNVTTPLSASLEVRWLPLDFLPQGDYEMWVWIPSLHAGVTGTYQVLSAKESDWWNSFSTLNLDSGGQVNQESYRDAWVKAGAFNLQAPSALGAMLKVPKGVTGEIVVDAIAILKKKD